jgi:hypothetical protein
MNNIKTTSLIRRNPLSHDHCRYHAMLPAHRVIKLLHFILLHFILDLAHLYPFTGSHLFVTADYQIDFLNYHLSLRLMLSSQDLNHPFVQCIHAVYTTRHHLVAVWFSDQLSCIAVLVLMQPLFYSILSPKCKSSDDGNSDVPKRSHKLLPLNENVKVQKDTERNHIT